MTEEAVNSTDQPDRGVDGDDIEAFHQSAAPADHVPAIPVTVVVMVDLRCHDEAISRFGSPQLADGGFQLVDTDEGVAGSFHSTSAVTAEARWRGKWSRSVSFHAVQ